MKKLITTFALCLGTAAFAQDAQQEQPSKQQVPGPKMEKKLDTGIDATEVGPGIGKAAKSVVGAQTEDEGTFKMQHAMNLRGTLKDATADGVSIARKGLPDADLDVRDKTVLMLDGKKVSKTDEIPEGSQVRAKFQLEGQEVVALELRATSPKGMKKDTKKMEKKEEPATGGSGMQELEKKDEPATGGSGMQELEKKEEPATGGSGMQELEKDAEQAGDKAEQKGEELKHDANKELNQ